VFTSYSEQRLGDATQLTEATANDDL